MRAAALGLAACLLAGAAPGPTTAEADQKAFQAYFRSRFPEVPMADFANGPYAVNAAMRKQWEEIMQFPPYDFALDEGKTVLLEGGQATLLDVDHGTYPFVTSSSATAGGACTGSGIGPRRIDKVIGVVKAYTTRVGEGPFPTELLDADGERLRSVGREYGTTTGRPRRCGWYDAVIARYAARVNGITDFVLTKLDVLTGWEQVPVCVAYEVDGRRLPEMPMTQTEFHHAVPVYEYLDGWSQDLGGARTFADLPGNAQRYVQALQEMSGAPFASIGVGPDREQTLQLRPLV